MDSVQRTGRKYEVLACIAERIVLTGTSPTYEEIGDALSPKIKYARAKQLVRKLEADELVVRRRGSQRGLTVPGLAQMRPAIVAKLRLQGIEIGDDLLPPPHQQQQLPLVVKLKHIPDV